MSPSAFLDPDLFPELAALRGCHRVIRDEALALKTTMTFIDDQRVEPRTWGIVPFGVEEDDRSVVADHLCQANRLLAPQTVALIDRVPGVLASTFSSLAPGATIGRHVHYQPNVTAGLCLQGGGSSWIEVDTETRTFADGEWTIFDYTKSHAITNNGSIDRIVLLLALPNPTRHD